MEFEPYHSTKYYTPLVNFFNTHTTHIGKKEDTNVSIHKTMEFFEKLKCGEYENVSQDNCAFNNLRIHYIDPRIFFLHKLFDIHDYIFEDFKNHTFDQIWSNIVEYIGYGDTEDQIIDCQKMISPLFQQELFLSPFHICKSVMSNIKNIFPTIFETWNNSSSHYLKQNSTIIMKNFIYQTWKDFIELHLGKNYIDDLKKFHNYLNENDKNDFDEIFLDKDFIVELLLVYNNIFMDIYTIGKIFDNEYSCSNIILYEGQNHIQTFVKFLSKFGFKIIKKVDNNSDSLCVKYDKDFLVF